MSTTKHFDSVKDQIGRCGIWCGSCVAGNGVLQETLQTGALKAGLMVKKERVDRKTLLEKWTEQRKNTWPFPLLFRC